MRIPHLNQPSSRKHPQRGAAFIVMLVILVMGVATVLVSALNSANTKLKRDVKTTEALAQAKEAIIGKAAISNDYVGGLYCPDTTGDGISDAGGNGVDCSQYIGLLPYQTLGLPDLRDSSGEKLWYALSRNVRRYPSVIPLNSDTAAVPANKLLSVSGDYSAAELVAIVLAPGDNVSGQSRSDNISACTTTGDSRKESLCAANYLEGSNDNPSNSTTQNTSYQSSNNSIEFNDQIITISYDQLFSSIHQRIGGELRKHLNSYFTNWGAYPFAAPFTDPSSASYRGTSSTYEGLYPFGSLIGIGSLPPNPQWSSSPITINFSGAPTPAFSCSLSSSNWTDSRVRCTSSLASVTLPSGATVTMTAKLKNVGLGFWKPFSLDLNNNNVADSDEQVRVRDVSGGTYYLATSSFDPASVSVTGKLNYSDGSATITFTAKGKPGGSTFNRIDIRDIQYESGTLPNWIHDNSWHQLMYYAVSPGNAPAGSGGASTTCADTPPCLTLTGSNGGIDKKALIIMTGRGLSGAHPSPTLGNYLEGENASTSDYLFTNQQYSSSFNDHVVVVAP